MPAGVTPAGLVPAGFVPAGFVPAGLTPAGVGGASGRTGTEPKVQIQHKRRQQPPGRFLKPRDSSTLPTTSGLARVTYADTGHLEHPHTTPGTDTGTDTGPGTGTTSRRAPPTPHTRHHTHSHHRTRYLNGGPGCSGTEQPDGARVDRSDGRQLLPVLPGRYRRWQGLGRCRTALCQRIPTPTAVTPVPYNPQTPPVRRSGVQSTGTHADTGAEVLPSERTL